MMTTVTTTGTTKSIQLRHELKHQISLQEDLVLAGRLRRLFHHDAHAGTDGTYRITSLYFDTPYDAALREKLDGVDRREKFRLRYYGGDPDWLKLEKKYKINGLCGKRSARLFRGEAEALLSGEYGFLLRREEPLLQELYSKLRGNGLAPRTVVCYDREAFAYAPGNVRVTLDRNIRTGRSALEFFRPERFALRPLEGCTVLEVKYDAFLPELVRLAVQIPDRRAGACSKYALCRRFD
ncbi:polyphosphate polymerase domain-containing protein [uncultured Flavonifractor sp.]|uniref:polyphosphate polymerase domain-containing protein n=1 Tax=uncultured Flavonifractor sp. TaxID=1193534 RepID=UPI0025F02CAB|nr:polyphosphate polymerase domain-containing protein [uncultured Flavonifractor sp.]